MILVPFDHLTPEYVSWLNDPETVRFSEQRHKTHTLESCRAYVRSRDYLYAIEVEGEHIGNVDVDYDSINGVADISILLGRKRGMGYGSAAFQMACALAVGLGARKIGCGMMATNLGMRKVALKAGMVEDGRRLRHFLCDGKEVDLIHYAKFTDRPVL